MRSSTCNIDPLLHRTSPIAAGDHIPVPGQARGGDTVRSLQRGEESAVWVEKAEEGRRAVVGAEAAEEMGIGDDAAPGLADSCGAGEGARPRREAEQELGEEVLVIQRGRRRGRI